MKKKVLFVANIHNHFNTFHLPHIAELIKQGFEVHCAANGYETKVPFVTRQHNVPIQRNLFSSQNFKAYKQLKALLQTEKYDLVHCHTSMGGAIGRLASISSRKLGTKVLFTSHEFPFYDNWMLKNWFTYFPIELLLAPLADGIVSINQFDFKLLNSGLFRCKHKYKITGVGVDGENFKPITIEEKSALRKKYDFKEEDFILIYAAEHTTRKNHKFIIEAAPLLNAIPNLKIICTGRGVLQEYNKKIANEAGLKNMLFTGYVANIREYMALSDVGISASFGEGLGINLVEELFLGKPIIASNNKGHREVVMDGINGFLFQKGDHQGFVNAVKALYEGKSFYQELSEKAPETAQKFSIADSVNQMSAIYSDILK
jgi:glycosyltransferase EpsD